MSAPRRARIHKRVGEAIEAAQGRRRERYLAELAYHFTRAADPEDAEKAITYALRAGEQATAMLAHEEAAEHYARALDVQGRFQPDASERRCELLLAARRGPGPGRGARARLVGVPRGGGAGRAARRRRGARARGDRGVAQIRAAAGGGRHRADRDARARARARARPLAGPGPPARVPVRSRVLLARARSHAGAERGSDVDRHRAAGSGGARVRLLGAAPGAVGRAPPTGARRGIDRDAHARAPDREPRAPAPGARVARRRPARARRPRRGRRPDRGVRGRREPAAPAPVLMERDPVAGDAGACSRGRSNAPTGWRRRRSPPGRRPRP